MMDHYKQPRVTHHIHRYVVANVTDYGYQALTTAEEELIDQFLSPSEVADKLGVSRQRVGQLLRGGRLPVIHVGDPVREYVLRRDLARYAAGEGRKWTWLDHMGYVEFAALVAVLQAAEQATVCESSHPRDQGKCGSCPSCVLRAALDRLPNHEG